MRRVMIIVLLDKCPKLLQSIGFLLIVDFVECCLVFLERVQSDVLVLENLISESNRLTFLVLLKVAVDPELGVLHVFTA